jgi:NADH dehydrogenase [ubiquinone] 1 alpha subcomplex assembly factor 1
VSEAQIEMYKEKVRSIGISLLGGNSSVGGRYELGIDSISITNDENLKSDARGDGEHPHLNLRYVLIVM